MNVLKIVAADASDKKTIVDGSASVRINSIGVTSDDSSNRILQLILTKASVDYLIASVTVVAGAGSNGTDPSVNLLNATSCPYLVKDAYGNYYLKLLTGEALSVKSTTTVTSGKTLGFTVHGPAI